MMKTPVLSRKLKSGALSVALLALAGGAAYSLYTPERSVSHATSSTGSADREGAKASRLDRARAPGLRHTYSVRFDQDLTLSGGTGKSPSSNTSVRIKVTGDLSLA